MTEAKRDPASYTDPNGYVFWQDQQVFRRIYPDKAPFFRTLLANPAVQALQADGKLIPTRIVADDAEGLLLSHETVWPLSYPQEWCAPMLKDAAAVVLDVASALAAAGYGLADGHPWNVLFHQAKPVFIDIGSITEAPEKILWPAQVQFNKFCLYPLHLYAGGLPELAKARLYDLALGVDADLALRALPATYKVKHPLTFAKLMANQAAARMTAKADMARENAPATAVTPAKGPDAATLQAVRRPFFDGIRRELAGIAVGGAGSDWAQYYASCPSMAATDAAAKAQVMAAYFDELKPKTVLDLGSNTGQYAMMAATKGARVVALDQDEPTVAALYRQVRDQHLDVLPLVMDLANPSPANGWCSEQRPDALTRFRSDCVLMLALIHHLVFTGNNSLEQVARLAAKGTHRFAIIEWVALDDPMSVYLTRTTTKDFSFYTLDRFVATLEAAGFKVRVEAPYAATRQFLVCERTA